MIAASVRVAWKENEHPNAGRLEQHGSENPELNLTPTNLLAFSLLSYG
jgi:hypothetical protein